VIANASGRAIGFALAPGQAHELPLAPLLLTLLSLIPGWIVADRGYASQAFRDLIWSLGARPAIPSKSNEAPVHCPAWIYVNRNRVERLWSRLKEWRAVATRYEKTACSFMGVLCMAATMDWIKYQHRTQELNGPSITVAHPYEAHLRLEQSTTSSRRAHLLPGSLARRPAPNTCKPKALIAQQGKSNCSARVR